MKDNVSEQTDAILHAVAAVLKRERKSIDEEIGRLDISLLKSLAVARAEADMRAVISRCEEITLRKSKQVGATVLPTLCKGVVA